jgi:hypothetical protein
MSRREEKLRQLVSINESIQTFPPPSNLRQFDRSFSTNDLNGEESFFHDQLVASSNLNDSNSMEVDQTENTQRVDLMRQRRKSLPSSCIFLDPLISEESTENVPLNSVFYGRKIADRYIRFEKETERISKRDNTSVSDSSSNYQTLRRMIHDDLVEVEDPKTPIANLNSSLNANQMVIAGTSSNSQDLQQMFTSNQSNDVHSILSPPASNEQVDGNPALASIQQHTPGDKSQQMQAQTLISASNQSALMLHSTGWNTVSSFFTKKTLFLLNSLYL